MSTLKWVEMGCFDGETDPQAMTALYNGVFEMVGEKSEMGQVSV
jgi:hypothetical protein